MSREVISRASRDIIVKKEIDAFLETGKPIKGHIRTIAQTIYDKYPEIRSDKGRQSDINKIRYSIQYRIGSVGKQAKFIRPKTAIMIHKQDDKKKGITNWREYISLAKQKKKLRKKSSWTQDTGNISIDIKGEWIIVQPLSDTHIGSFATDYEKFEEYTEYLKSEKRLFTCLIGDMTDHFVNFRNMAAVHGQILSPQEQRDVFASWVEEIQDKVLFSTWCNHSEFEEKFTGFNSIKYILERKGIYFNGIGKCNLRVNNAIYQICATHKTRYFSSFNLTHGLLQLARKDVQGMDIYIGGDKHEPALTQAPVGGKITTLIQLGTLKTEDTFSKRYFSYTTNPEMPCFALNSKVKKVVPFTYLRDALEFIGH
jgi:hypothetical protein